MDMIHTAQSQQNPVNFFIGVMHSLGLSVRTLSKEYIGGGESLLAVSFKQQVDRYSKKWYVC